MSNVIWKTDRHICHKFLKVPHCDITVSLSKHRPCREGQKKIPGNVDHKNTWLTSKVSGYCLYITVITLDFKPADVLLHVAAEKKLD